MILASNNRQHKEKTQSRLTEKKTKQQQEDSTMIQASNNRQHKEKTQSILTKKKTKHAEKFSQPFWAADL
jgi:hypothetical protein